MLAIAPARLLGAAAPLLVTAALALVAAAPASAVSDTTAAGPSGPVSFHPFTIPSDDGCVRWRADGSYNCDPVNVVFPWGARRDRSAISCGAAGGRRFDLGSTQRLHFATSTLYSQDVQVFRADGRNSIGQSLRYHMRLWRVRGTTATVAIGAVHHEARVGFFEDRARPELGGIGGVRSEPSSAERPDVRRTPRSRRSRACRHRARRPARAGVWWRGWYNDARPTVIP